MFPRGRTQAKVKHSFRWVLFVVQCVKLQSAFKTGWCCQFALNELDLFTLCTHFWSNSFYDKFHSILSNLILNWVNKTTKITQQIIKIKHKHVSNKRSTNQIKTHINTCLLSVLKRLAVAARSPTRGLLFLVAYWR